MIKDESCDDEDDELTCENKLQVRKMISEVCNPVNTATL